MKYKVAPLFFINHHKLNEMFKGYINKFRRLIKNDRRAFSKSKRILPD
jgi:hypothetical protein